MNDERRIITPGELGSRQRQRAGLVEENKRLQRKVADSDFIIRRQAAAIQEQAASIGAMNRVFTDIATALGTPVPKVAAEGPAALKAMKERIETLVNMGSAAKEQ